MDSETGLPLPILFNPWKHHQDYIIGRIKELVYRDDFPLLFSNLKKIGESTTDLYTGKMGMDEIAVFTRNILEKKDLKGEASYLQWILDSEGEFRTESFPDLSVWVFKVGIEEGRYVHIHPGRNVPLTMRVKANVLKTAIAVNAKSMIDGGNPLDITNINLVRREILRLDPIKFVTLNQELGRMIYHFANKFGNLV